MAVAIDADGTVVCLFGYSSGYHEETHWNADYFSDLRVVRPTVCLRDKWGTSRSGSS